MKPLSEASLKLVRRMKRLDYWYDELESYRGYLRFFAPPPCNVLEFRSWKEVKEWLKEAKEEV